MDQRTDESDDRAAHMHIRCSPSLSTASGCYREAAQLATDVGDYKRAIERWEQVAQMSLDSTLTRYSVKDYYLNAGLCYLALPVSRSEPARH